MGWGFNYLLRHFPLKNTVIDSHYFVAGIVLAGAF